MKRFGYFLIIAVLSVSSFGRSEALKGKVQVGSKNFTESYILAELIAQEVEAAGEGSVIRKFGLGGTGITFAALLRGDIDIYPEYSGTISEEILKDPTKKSLDVIRAALAPMGLVLSDSLGFNNTYALAVTAETAQKYNLESLSDLANHRQIKAGFSHEFLKRQDGFPGLSEKYGIAFDNVKGIEHSLAFDALEKGEIAVTDVYSTDAKIVRYNLKILNDDKGYFPVYKAVFVARKAFIEKFPKTWARLLKFQGKISAEKMRKLNAFSDLDQMSFSNVVSKFLKGETPSKTTTAFVADDNIPGKILLYTKQHLFLVGISLLFAIFIGVPLGIIAAEKRKTGQIIIIVSGILQTIPSLALLCFLIPFFGIGTFPSLIALFLYGLLPIVVSTYTGLTTIDGRLRESSRALGLSRFQKLLLIELPLASPSILAGIKTSAVINIGTATLAALIGAGGYGTPIVTGLALNNISMILQGAIPAAVMALLAHGFFELLNRLIIPRGLIAK